MEAAARMRNSSFLCFMSDMIKVGLRAQRPQRSEGERPPRPDAQWSVESCNTVRSEEPSIRCFARLLGNFR
jgi:hypothetical protein